MVEDVMGFEFWLVDEVEMSPFISIDGLVRGTLAWLSATSWAITKTSLIDDTTRL